MRETMVRTQVYLPRDIHSRLQKRAREHELTLAVQIRTALEDYLEQVEAQDDGVLHADDPIFQMIGMVDSGLGDLSVNHDHYLYGAPKRELIDTPAREVVKEKPSSPYTRRAPKKKSRRKSG